MQNATVYLNKAQNVFNRHRLEITSIMRGYRENISTYDSRYAAEFASQKKAEARTEAKGRIAQADREMHESIQSLMDGVKKEIRSAIIRVPDHHFMESMRAYRDFNLMMTETELRAFAESASDCHAELRVLQAVAAKSGFKLSIPSIEEIEKDVMRIERAARIPSMYAPSECYAEAKDLLGEKIWFCEDGSTYPGGEKVDSIYLSGFEMSRNRLEADIAGPMLERWKGVQPVTIEKAEPAEGESTEEAQKRQEAAEGAAREKFAADVEISRDGMAEANAAAIAAANAESSARSKEILSKYTKR